MNHLMVSSNDLSTTLGGSIVYTCLKNDDIALHKLEIKKTQTFNMSLPCQIICDWVIL